MISQLLCALIDSDPLYVAKRTADTRRYIMAAWRKAHDSLLTKMPWHCFSATRYAAA